MRADQVKNKLSLRRRERGAALLMVLLAIVVFTVFLLDVQQEASVAVASSISARDRLKAEYAAKSGVNLSRMLISTEPTIRKTVEPMIKLLNPQANAPQIPVWEFADQVLAPFNCPDKHASFASLAGVDASNGENLGQDICFDPVIVDEDSKININTAARPDAISKTRIASQIMAMMAGPQYNPLFENEDSDGQRSDRTTICGALMDWADPDEDQERCDLTAQAPVSGGAEDNYYQTIGLPYLRKNAAYDSLEELRLVRGVGDDFWHTFVDPDPSNPKKRVVTVWGQGKVNVNTANAQTLLAMVCAYAVPETPLCNDPTQAGAFLQIVTLARTFTAGAPLFGSATDFINTMKGGGLVGPQMAAFGVQPVVFLSEAELKNVVGVKSKMFSVYAEGIVPGRGREARVSVHAVIDFRNASELPQQGGLLAALGQDPNSSGGGDDPRNPGGLTGPGAAALQGNGGDADQVMAALASNPAGQVVYYRVD